MIGARAVRRVIGRAVGRSVSERGGGADRSGWAAFRSELARSRRFGDPLTIVRARLRARAVAPDATPTPDRLVRVVDRAWIEGDQAYFVLPHATAADAAALLDRLAAESALPLARDGARIVTFPDDGLTEDVLVDALHAPAAPASPTPLRVQPVADAEDDDVSIAVGGG